MEPVNSLDPPTTLDDRARWAFGLLARQDLSEAERIRAPQAVDHFLPVRDAVGRAGIVEFFEQMFSSFPDLEIKVEHTVAAEPYVVVQWTATGTFAGTSFQGIRATGRQLPARGSRGDRALTRAFNAVTWIRTMGGRRLRQRTRAGS